MCKRLRPLHGVGCRNRQVGPQDYSRVKKALFSQMTLERSAREGESPVGEKQSTLDDILSTTGHEKPCGKQGRPLPKAKYDLTTDSEQVP